jgi:hypothetical protein
MRGLELGELAHERVELGVGDLRGVVQVIAIFVVSDQLAKPGDALCRGHVFNLSVQSPPSLWW